LYAQVRTPRFAKRRRSPAPAIIIAVIILLLGCWILNMTCGSKKKADTSALNEYVNRVRPIADASSSVGQSWGSIRANLPQLIADPDGLNEQLKQVEQQCKDLADEVQAISVPESLREAHAVFRMCLEQRYRAVKNYRPDIINALSAVDVSVYAKSISEDLQQLMYSDGAYKYYKQSITEMLTQQNVTEIGLPDSVWLPNWEEASQNRVESFLVGLRGTELHGLAVGTVSLKPEGRLYERGGETIHGLPATDEVEVTVNVQNQGNRPEKEVVVSLSLYSEENLTPSKQEQTIASIQPGETLQVVFSGLKPVQGGTRNILEIKVGPVPKEAFIDNNQKLIYFTVE
jgi:hypothetical protein